MPFTIDHPESAFGMWLPKGPMESASPGACATYPTLEDARNAAPPGWTIGHAVTNGRRREGTGEPLFTITFVEVKRS